MSKSTIRYGELPLRNSLTSWDRHRCVGSIRFPAVTQSALTARKRRPSQGGWVWRV